MTKPQLVQPSSDPGEMPEFLRRDKASPPAAPAPAAPAPASPAAAPDPFDVSLLRLDQSFTETSGVKKLLVSVRVGKPNKQDFIRVNPDPAYRAQLALILLHDESETYLLTPAVAHELPNEFVMATVFTCINRQGNSFLWPVRLPPPDGKVLEWHRTAQLAAELAMEKWVRVVPNMSDKAYDIFESQGIIPDPEWPVQSFSELLRIAFRDHYVGDLNHKLIKRLHGHA